jgi:predicted transcriptional regulator
MKYDLKAEDVTKVIKDLLTVYSPEEIAVEVGRTGQTIWRWVSGRSIPSKGDFRLLENMAKKIKE